MTGDAEAVFAGMMTLDIAHTVAAVPGPNQKIVAGRQFVAAGGPAANAAAACAALDAVAGDGGTCADPEAASAGADRDNRRAARPIVLCSLCGSGTLADAARSDMEACGVRVVDCAGGKSDILPVSLIMVEQANGDRAVSGRSPGAVIDADMVQQCEEMALNCSVVLVDGHYCDIGAPLARRARQSGATVVLDGGSWKKDLGRVLPYVDVAVVSADFRVPGAGSVDEMVQALFGYGVNAVVRTAGHEDIRYWIRGGAPEEQAAKTATISGVVAVEPHPHPVCTLGAGDIFHGAFTWWLWRRSSDLGEENLRAAIAFASRVARASLDSFGTREWMGQAWMQRAAVQ